MALSEPAWGCLGFYCIPESTYGVVQRCGAHQSMIYSGPNCVMPFIDNVATLMTLRQLQIEVDVSTKTKDNVTCTIVTAVQYAIHAPSAEELAAMDSGAADTEFPLYSAFYLLQDPQAQINNFVENVIRGALPRMDLDDVFASKDELSNAVKDQLNDRMKTYGYTIKTALVVDIIPARNVADSMNEINAQSRMREAATHKAEGDKILKVKAAEAEAESKYLSGLGVARQRKAIVEGLRDTVSDFSGSVKGAGPQDVMDILLLTQYFDMLKVVGSTGSGGGTLFLPHGPHSISSLRTDLKDNFQNAK